MPITDPAEQAPPPAAKPDPKDQIFNLDADAGEPFDKGSGPAAETTEKVDPEDIETKADDAAKDAEPAEDSGEDKTERESESKRRRAREKTRLAALIAENEALKRIAPKQDDATALQGLVDKEIGPAPREADFTDYLEFQNAKIAYEVEKRSVARELKHRAAQAEEFQQTANEEIIEAFKERADVARKTIRDFDEITKAATMSPEHPEVIHLILSSEKGPELAYYLSKNPKVVQRLNEMSPIMAAREIGKLEASVSSATPKTVTKAPSPIDPLRGGTTARLIKDPSKIQTYEDYQAWVKSGAGG